MDPMSWIALAGLIANVGGQGMAYTQRKKAEDFKPGATSIMSDGNPQMGDIGRLLASRMGQGGQQGMGGYQRQQPLFSPYQRFF